MLLTPFAVLRLWIFGLLAVAVLGTSAYLFSRWYDQLPRAKTVVVNRGTEIIREVRPLRGPVDRVAAWRPALDQTTMLLVAASTLLAWSFLGHFVNPRLFRKSGTDDPKTERDGEVHRIQRPDGTELHVEVVGPATAPSVIFTHGWSCDRDVWYYAKRHLRGKYRVILWDLPGSGYSSSPANRDFTLEKMASDMRAVIAETCPGPVVLVGHSIGGMIMLTFCRLFPELLGPKVSGLVLLHTTYTNPLHTMGFARLYTALQKPVIEPLLHLTIWLSPIVRVMNWLSYMNGSAHWNSKRDSFAGTETRGQLDFAARYIVKHSPAVLARGALGMLRYDATDVLSRVDIPAVVVVGDRDQVTKPEAGRHIDATMPQSRYFPLSPAKHLGIIERHAELNEVLDQFLETMKVESTKPNQAITRTV